MLKLTLLLACWTQPPRVTPPVSLTSRVVALEAELIAATDRIAELESRQCVDPETLAIRLEHVPHRDELSEILKDYATEEVLDLRLELMATLDDLDDLLEDTVSPAMLDERIANSLVQQDLEDALLEVITIASLRQALAEHPTREELAKALRPYATRAWTDSQYATRFDRVMPPQRTVTESERAREEPPSP